MSLTSKVKVGMLGGSLILGLVAPYLLGPFAVSIVTLGLILGLFAMSIDLMGGYGGLVSLGQAGILAASSYGVGYMASRVGAGHLEQITVALLAGLAISMVFALMAMRVSQVYFLMVTLAQGMIVWGFATRSTDLGAENGLRGVTRPEAVAAYWKYYYLCLGILAVCGGMMWLIVRSPLGLSLKGLKESPTRLQMLGYNPALTKLYVFMLAGFFATISGILYAYYNQFVSPSNAAFLMSGKGVLMAILGGIGTLVGPVIGAFIIVFIENILSIYVARWPTVLGLLFIFTIIFARNGLVGAISASWYRWLGRSAGDEDRLGKEEDRATRGEEKEPTQPLTQETR
ncbi:MAG: branched-chain amino acid ABC transporter permease [Nitriliruptorales bacterium]|nr:branched-chain amino acid ABC transporter permease [Nitriliruptorales bacterium]